MRKIGLTVAFTLEIISQVYLSKQPKIGGKLDWSSVTSGKLVCFSKLQFPHVVT